MAKSSEGLIGKILRGREKARITNDRIDPEYCPVAGYIRRGPIAPIQIMLRLVIVL